MKIEVKTNKKEKIMTFDEIQKFSGVYISPDHPDDRIVIVNSALRLYVSPKTNRFEVLSSDFWHCAKFLKSDEIVTITFGE